MIKNIAKRVALTLSCQSGRSATGLSAALAILAAPAALAGPTGWAHQAAGFQSNGAVMVRSLAGGSYSGTQNPTGAVAKANQSAVTQAPTVIIQATSGSTMFELTTNVYTGNLGGLDGADEKCRAEFGPAWKMATLGKLMAASTHASLIGWLRAPNNRPTCTGYTSNSGQGSITLPSGGNGSYSTWGYQTDFCSIPYPIVCVGS